MPEDIRPERDSPENLEARVDEIENCLRNLKFSGDELEAFDKVTKELETRLPLTEGGREAFEDVAKKLRNIFSRCIH
jgi:hypothetical protein